MNEFDQKSMENHIAVLGWLNIADGVLTLIIGALIFMLLTRIGVASGEPAAMTVLTVLTVVGSTTGMMMTALALPSILAGYGLLRGKNWGRLLMIVVSFFNLFLFPIGTALGIYGLYVLLRQEATEYFVLPKTA